MAGSEITQDERQGDAVQAAAPTQHSLSAEDLELRREERAVKRKELEVRRHEAEKSLALKDAPWWRKADPLVLAIVGAILTLIGNMGVAIYNNSATIAQEEKKNANALAQQKQKADDDLRLEEKKASYNLILQAIATNDPDTAERNINFFISAGLLDDRDNKIRQAIAAFKPVLPAPAGAGLAGRNLAIPDIARLYNFPTELDGAGQVIGILEFGGGFRAADVESYFTKAKLPIPTIVPVPVDGAKNSPGNISADGQVALDIQIIGTIAPQAQIRVYFASIDGLGYANAVRRAIADHVTVISSGWGLTESEWKSAQTVAVNQALQDAAMAGITVVVAAGDDGVTNGVEDGRPHVDFPASSPWVLAVGGTSITMKGNQILTEAAWKEGEGLRMLGGGSTGGGVSDLFAQPEWQSEAKVPLRRDGNAGRGIPDVAAVADSSVVVINVGGVLTPTGGTSVSAPLWAGLIGLINQGLGRNVGYVNPRLYREIGPAGVLRGVTKGDNSVKGVQGFSAGPGWNAVAGWGTPDGRKLLAWLRAHP